MDAFLKGLNDVIGIVNGYLTDYILIVLLIGIGLFYTIRTRFVQVRCFGEGWKKLFGSVSLNGEKAGKGGMSSFQALTTAIAAQVGTGNIVGACSAIIFGGPGAIFWMWIIAFLGMATIYAEATIAQKTKVVDEAGEVTGGPAYYIRRAFKGKVGKVMAAAFSVLIIFALAFFGSMVQSNSIAGAVETAFQIPTWATGIVLALVAGLIFIGGVKSIASVTEKLVPIMACLYILGALIVICMNITAIPAAFGIIFASAFSPAAVFGGAVGYTIKEAIARGANRGLFSNEAGMGSTPHAHAVAKVEKAHDQGVVAIVSVFIDTFIVLTLTALVVITTMYVGKDNAVIGGYGDVYGSAAGNLAQDAFSAGFGSVIGPAFVAICLLFFAFSTIIGWNFFGRLNVTALFGNTKLVNIIFSVVSMVFVFLGTLLKNDLVWSLSDLFNMLMVIPNVLALAVLSGLVVNALSERKKKNAASAEAETAAEEIPEETNV